MKFGIIGNGIVGSTIAASIRIHQPGSSVTLIDDNRPFKTSEAGQGYLWSAHRYDDKIGFKTSILAKKSWVDLLGSDGKKLLKPDGSLLISSNEDDDLIQYFERASEEMSSLELLEDASKMNKILRPEKFYGLYYPEDFTCVPPQLIQHLKQKFHLVTEERTVENLDLECCNSEFDYLICCAGPWINELQNVSVEPIRGILLEAEVENKDLLENLTPTMEFGYGGPGVHFTLSSRNDKLLIGASRESVGFSMNGIDEAEGKVIEHAKKFLGHNTRLKTTNRRIGFRPLCSNPNVGDRKYWIKKKHSEYGRIILVYGFEGEWFIVQQIQLDFSTD